MSTALRDSIVQLDEYRWMLPRTGGMRVPGILFASRPLLDKMLSDKTPEQVMNAAHLPGILDASIAMPDAHWGYGLPVGGVVATDPKEGVVSSFPRIDLVIDGTPPRVALLEPAEGAVVTDELRVTVEPEPCEGCGNRDNEKEREPDAK